MKCCAILFYLLAVVYSEGVGDDKSLQEQKELLQAKADAVENVFSKFYTNILKPKYLNFLDFLKEKVYAGKDFIFRTLGNIPEPTCLKFLSPHLGGSEIWTSANIFNILFVLGVVGLISPLEVSNVSFELFFGVGLLLLLALLSFFYKGLNKLSGFLLVSIYVLFLYLQFYGWV